MKRKKDGKKERKMERKRKKEERKREREKKEKREEPLKVSTRTEFSRLFVLALSLTR